MILINAFARLIVRVATVASVTCVAFLVLLALYFLGVPLHGDPVAAVLALGLGAALRLCRGSTPLQEIKRAVGYPDPSTLRSNNRRRVP
jgi:hypothetical protein